MSISSVQIEELIIRWDPIRDIDTIQFIKEGIETAAIVDFVSDHSPVVVKVHATTRYNSPRTFLSDAYSMKNLNSCTTTSIPTPNIHYISDQDPDYIDYPYFIMEQISDPTANIVFHDFSIKETFNYFSELGKYLGRIHSIPINTDSSLYGWCGYIDGQIQPFKKDNTPTLRTFLISEIQTHINRIRKQERFSTHLIKVAKELQKFVRSSDLLINRPKSYCHRDFKDANIFVDGDGNITSIIDWSPLIADPAYEFASVEFRLIDSRDAPKSHPDSSKLRKKYRNNYYQSYNLGKKFSSELVHLYKIIVILRSFASFNNWFREYSETEKNEIQSYYTKHLNKHINALSLM